MPKLLTVWITTNCGKFSKRWKYQTTLSVSSETYVWVKKQQLEPDMGQQTGSKLGNQYLKAVYCHPSYLTSMQNANLESKLPGKISITLDILMNHPYGRKQRGTKEPLDESERGE